MVMVLRQYDQVWANYTPQRTDDLKPEALAAVGRRFLWEAGWIIEEEDSPGGPYVGQWAMIVQYHPAYVIPRFAWAPSCDLSNVQPAPQR